MSDSTPRLGLPWLMPAQAQKHVTVNESLGRLDALVQAAVRSRATAVQPASPVEGEAYILPSGAAGADWDGFADHDLVYFQDGAWSRIAARAGLTAYVEDEDAIVLFDGLDWRPLSALIAALSNLESLGVGAAPDAFNPFLAKLNSALWTARYAGEGGSGDLRSVFNKEAQGGTASLVFQSAFSGRAEFGLTGSDDVSLKVSPDGVTWTEAWRANHQTGHVQLGRAAIGALQSVNGGPLAGARRLNINGAFEVWQRGTGPFAGGALTACADQWSFARNNMTVQRSADAPDARFSNCVEFSTTNAEPAGLFTNIESAAARSAAGRRVTVSFWAKGVAGAGDLRVYLRTANARDDFSAVTLREILTPDPALPGAGSWSHHTVTSSGAVANIENGLRVQIDRNGGDAHQTRITGVQVEFGEVATPYEIWPCGAEDLACHRYLQRLGGFTLYNKLALLTAVTTTVADGVLGCLLPMRRTPSVSFTGNFELLANSTFPVTLSMNWPTRQTLQIRATGAGLTPGAGYLLRASNDAAANILLSAEL